MKTYKIKQTHRADTNRHIRAFPVSALMLALILLLGLIPVTDCSSTDEAAGVSSEAIPVPTDDRGTGRSQTPAVATDTMTSLPDTQKAGYPTMHSEATAYDTSMNTDISVAPLQATGETTATTSTAEGNTFTLEAALDLGLIKIKINGYTGDSEEGVSSGGVIEISFQRQKPETIIIDVLPGTILKSDDTAKQNMILFKLLGSDPVGTSYQPEVEIKLDTDEWMDYLFEAYCKDLHKDNILSSTTFSVGEPASDEIVDVMESVAAMEEEEKETTIPGIQLAIWTITDDPSKAELQEMFPFDTEDMDIAWMILEDAGIDPATKRLFAGYTPET